MSQQPTTQFLSPEESAAVDKALLASHEKFLTRLTISSLRLLTHIAQDTGVTVEELTPQQVIDWFENDSKIRHEQGSDAAFLKWWLGTATPLIPSYSQGGNLSCIGTQTDPRLLGEVGDLAY